MPESSIAESLTGGCQCGAVRYRLDGPPTRASLCTCRMCQKAVGGPFLADLNIPRDRVTWIRGQPAEFQSSSVAIRTFCAACGTPLGFRYVALPDEVGITIFSLDTPGAVIPTRLHGAETKPVWLNHIADFATFTTADDPPPDGLDFRNFQHPDHD